MMEIRFSILEDDIVIGAFTTKAFYNESQKVRNNKVFLLLRLYFNLCSYNLLLATAKLLEHIS